MWFMIIEVHNNLVKLHRTYKINGPRIATKTTKYRNAIACSSPGERIFIYFEKIRFFSQRTEFLNFFF